MMQLYMHNNIMGYPWSKLLHDYNLFEGRVCS